MEKKLSKKLENIMETINIAQQIELGGEFLDEIELSQNNDYIVLDIMDGNDKYQYTCKLQQNDTEETIIKGLINDIYQKNILPMKAEIKEAKKYLNRRLEGIYKCENQLENLRNNQVYDSSKKAPILAQEDVINHEIFLKYRELDDAKVDLEQFSIYKNVLFQGIKELKEVA